MTELKDYWKQYQGYVNTLVGWYQGQSVLFQRFMKYGGWIFIQFWVIRAPMTVFLTSVFPETISFLVIGFPGYLLASFTSGTVLAIVGFFLSEKWIWRPKEDE